MRDQDSNTENTENTGKTGNTGNTGSTGNTGDGSDPVPAMMKVLQRLTEMNERLQRMSLAAESRDVIGQAKGILMERYSISHDEADGLLATAASRSNHTTVKAVAATLILTGHLPRSTRW